jgi:hypothetical protein
MINEQERAEKIALCELKEKVSNFLYKNYIDFERDKGVIIQEQVLSPAFFLNKYGIIIECFKMADEHNSDFVKKATLYIQDNVKFVALDLRHLATKSIDAALREQLPRLGCAL